MIEEINTENKLTHFNDAGEAHMVDVHAKDDTYRVARAAGTIKVKLVKPEKQILTFVYT